MPNPTRGNAVLELDLPKNERVEVAVFDLAGHRLHNVISQPLSVGKHRIDLGVESLAAGMYLCRVAVGQVVRTVKFSKH